MSVPTRTVLLVGDRFAGFAVQDHVLTVAQFLAELSLIGPGERIRVQAGQGVTTDEWESVHAETVRLGLGGQVEFRLTPPTLAGQAEVHKRLSQNALIADLREARDGLFTAALRLHNDNELLIDHQTGQHVQGMVAIEAARQMFLAVSERFYASRHSGRSYYY